LTISPITILPTKPVPQTTIRLVPETVTGFTIGGLAVVGDRLGESSDLGAQLRDVRDVSIHVGNHFATTRLDHSERDNQEVQIEPASERSTLMTSLSGRRALVTGGSRGIGAEIVRRLASDGAAVAFTYGASAEEAEKLVAEVTADGGTAIAIQADSGDPEQVAASVDETIAQLGGLDTLVNNAGVAYIADAESFPLEQFERLVAINVRGVFIATQRAIPHLGQGGRIINIGSINADRVPGPGLSVYAMTKGAVAGLTRALARELGPRGITVNNVQPGPIATEMNPDEGEFADSLRQVMPLGRYGHPRDVAGVVSYLAGPEAAYITGAHWDVDGGFTV
jgi:3-oxoacyl-[acyl-carrier protein] reductase